MFQLILRDIINDEVTRVNARTLNAIIAVLKKQKSSSERNRNGLDVLERKGKRIKKNKTFYDEDF